MITQLEKLQSMIDLELMLSEREIRGVSHVCTAFNKYKGISIQLHHDCKLLSALIT